jgi:hypothetical protein
MSGRFQRASNKAGVGPWKRKIVDQVRPRRARVHDGRPLPSPFS